MQVEGINFENYTLITNFYGMLPFGGVIMQKILVVEDDLDIQELLKNFLLKTQAHISRRIVYPNYLMRFIVWSNPGAVKPAEAG